MGRGKKFRGRSKSIWTELGGGREQAFGIELGTEELDELSRAWDEFLAGQETVNE